MPPMTHLDIGGGFSGSALNPENNFVKVGAKVKDYLDKVWPANKIEGIKIFGEPGRQIAQEAQTIVCNVYLTKVIDGKPHYYINNGVYQGFGCQVFDQETLKG